VANEVKGTENIIIIIAGEEKENNAIFLFLWTGRFAQPAIGSVFIRLFSVRSSFSGFLAHTGTRPCSKV
jgi:hypothetical protein